ncbi:MAG: hypothetical protein ACREJX_18145, partial [Polyangiaceae bacterium]
MKRLAAFGCSALLTCASSGCANGLLSGDDPDAGKSNPVWRDASTASEAGTSDDGGDCKTDLAQPWQGSGVGTAWMDQSVLTLVSGDRYWTYDYGNATWGVTGHVETLWAGAPAVDDLMPWQDVGVHAAYVVGTTLTLISADRYWTLDTGTHAWGTTGHIVTMWSSAPANG